MGEVGPPTPHPCETCPYRKDAPSGVWAAEEYERLRSYDAQPIFSRRRSVNATNTTRAAGGHGSAQAGPVATTVITCWGYESLFCAARWTPRASRPRWTPVSRALFGSSAEAADHGEAAIRAPAGLAA
ncbi:MAG: DUF6283 family protein [Micromonosporaceae bacterium]